MEVSKRKKWIPLISALSFLAITLIISTVLIVNRNQKEISPHARHMARILKRPIVTVHKNGLDNSDIVSIWYDMIW